MPGATLVNNAMSEWKPALFFAKFAIAHIGTQSCANTNPNRDQHDIAAAQIAGVKTADKIGLTFACTKALIKIVTVIKIIDQGKAVGGIGTCINTD